MLDHGGMSEVGSFEVPGLLTKCTVGEAERQCLPITRDHAKVTGRNIMRWTDDSNSHRSLQQAVCHLQTSIRPLHTFIEPPKMRTAVVRSIRPLTAQRSFSTSLRAMAAGDTGATRPGGEKMR
jgi:hypothetical protein